MAKFNLDNILEQLKKSEERLEPRFERMDEDYRLFRLENPFTPEKGYMSYCSNRPKTLADKVIDVACKAMLGINVKQDENKEGDKTRAEIVESFVRSCLYQNDEALAKMHISDLMTSLNSYGALRGWEVVLPLVYKKEWRGDTIISILPIDPRNCLFGRGSEGLRWGAFKKHNYADEIEDEWKLKVGRKGDELRTIVDYWNEKYHVTLLLEGEAEAESGGKESYNTATLLRKPEEHKKGHLPFIILPVSHQPPMSLPGEDVTKDEGESIYASLRETFRLHNMIRSWSLDLVNLGRRQPIVITSRDGRTQLSTDPWVAGTAIHLQEGDRIDLLFQRMMPPDTGPMLNVIDQEIQQGGLPAMAYGEINFELSGAALAQLGQAITSVIGPLFSTTTRMYRAIAHELVDQFGQGGYKPVVLSGYDREGKAMFGTTVKPSDIKGSWFFDITMTPSLPAEDVIRTEKAKSLKALGVDDETIFEEVLKMRNARAVREQKWMQAAEQLFPELGMMRMANAFEDRGDMNACDIVRMNLIEMLQKKMGTQAPPMQGAQGQMQAGQTPMPMQGAPPPPIQPAEALPLEENPFRQGGQ